MKREDILNEEVMKISALAKSKKRENNKVIDATLGMFFSEDGKLSEIELINEELKNQINSSSLVYDSLIGEEKFLEYSKKYLIEEKIDSFCELGYTMGATGALSFCFNNYCESDDYVLVPSLRWENYDAIILSNKLKIKEYNFLKNNKLDLEDLNIKINEIKNVQNQIILLINDPCHNPTGYSMEDEEWEILLKNLKKISEEKNAMSLS